MTDSENGAAVLTESQGNVLLITLNRPDAMNSLTEDVLQGIGDALDELNETSSLRVGVLTGAGRGFCAGLDLKVFLENGLPDLAFEVFPKESKKPLIAAVENFALAGGLEVALMCDLIVASEGAKLGIPEVAVGLFAGGGALLRLPARIGYSRAMELALTGSPITAEEGLACGLVNKVVPVGSTSDEAMKLAERIAQNAPFGLTASKQIMRAGIEMAESDFWEHQSQIWERLMTTKDAQEGPRAFAEKRAPVWSED